MIERTREKGKPRGRTTSLSPKTAKVALNTHTHICTYTCTYVFNRHALLSPEAKTRMLSRMYVYTCWPNVIYRTFVWHCVEFKSENLRSMYMECRINDSKISKIGILETGKSENRESETPWHRQKKFFSTAKSFASVRRPPKMNRKEDKNYRKCKNHTRKSQFFIPLWSSQIFN